MAELSVRFARFAEGPVIFAVSWEVVDFWGITV